MKKSLVPLMCALGVLAFVLGACGSDTSDTTAASPSQTFSPSKGDGADDSAEADDPTFQDGVLTTPDLKVQITRYKVIKPGQKGNEYGKKPAIASGTGRRTCPARRSTRCPHSSSTSMRTRTTTPTEKTSLR